MTTFTLRQPSNCSRSPLSAAPALDGPVAVEQKTQLHRGSHSVVWSGWCPSTRQPLVLKTYIKGDMKQRHILNAHREIDILKQYALMKHPGIISLIHHWEDEDEINLLFEQCAGGDLFQNLMRQGGKLHEIYVCCQVVMPLLSTLQHLHNNHIVHRDIKPENIFLTASGELKLGDFGLAVSLSADKALARVGTLDYMAPEVLSMPSPENLAANAESGTCHSGYDEKVDIWALGVLVYELLMGKPPFEVEDTDATTQRIQTGTMQPLPESMSPSCQEFILNSLQRQPDLRPSAAELLKHPWVLAHRDTLAKMNSSDCMGSGDWSLKVAYPIPSGHQTLDATPPSSPTQQQGSSGLASPVSMHKQAAWKRVSTTCDSPLKRGVQPAARSRFAKSTSARMEEPSTSSLSTSLPGSFTLRR